MRIIINFVFDKPIKLNLQYNHIVQAVILKWLSDKNYTKFIHDTGYKCGNRTYKLYTFSRLQGRFSIDSKEKTITYYNEVKLEISAVDDKFLSYLVNGIIINDEVRLGNNMVSVKEVRCTKNILKSGDKVYTKSPIVTYSTFQDNEKKKTYYYSPFESEFSELIRKNLIKKYNAAYGVRPENCDFSIEAVHNSKLKEKVLVYKKTVIKGWTGEFILKGSKELINMGYNSGFGSKNSQGFGCVEKCNL